MTTLDQKIQRDKDWLNKKLEEFEAFVLAQGVEKDDFEKKQKLLKEFVWATTFQETLDGHPLEKEEFVSFQNFNLNEDKDAEKRKNLMAYWKEYLEAQGNAPLSQSQILILEHLIDAAIRLEQSPHVMIPFMFGQKNKGWHEYNSILDLEPNKDPEPSFKVGYPAVSNGPMMSPAVSKLFLTAGSFALGAGTSWLMNSASRHTICAAAGFLNLTLPSFVVTAATAAVVTTGREIYGNWDVISASFNEAQGFSKINAALIAAKDNIDGRKILRNTVIAGAMGFGGGLVAGAVMDLFSDASCLAENSADMAQASQAFVHDTARDVGLNYGGLQGDINSLEAQRADLLQTVDGLRDQNSGLSVENAELKSSVEGLQSDSAEKARQIAELNDRMAALETGETPPVVTGGVPVHSVTTTAIPADTAAGFIAPLGIDTTPVQIDAAVTSSAEIQPVTEAIAIEPSVETHKVLKGENLTHIVEAEYGIKEGDKNFDKVMAAVAKANGLEGAQMNWLKANWELAMPKVGDAASLTGEVDRLVLDQNMKAREVLFSSIPKFAPAVA